MTSVEADILLVEDNPTDAELLIRGLRKHGLGDRLVRVDDGAQALDFLLPQGPPAQCAMRSLPKVVFLDLKLPKVDGFQVLSKIKSDDRTRTIPVVVFTSSSETCDIEAAYSLGANSYVEKPIDCAELDDVICELGHYWGTLNQSP